MSESKRFVAAWLQSPTVREGLKRRAFNCAAFEKEWRENADLRAELKRLWQAAKADRQQTNSELVAAGFEPLGDDIVEWSKHLMLAVGVEEHQLSEHLTLLHHVRAWIQRETAREHIRAKIEAETAGPWSKPDSPAEWAKVYDVTPRTFSRWVDNGKIRAKKIDEKNVMVHLDDVPRRLKR